MGRVGEMGWRDELAPKPPMPSPFLRPIPGNAAFFDSHAICVPLGEVLPEVIGNVTGVGCIVAHVCVRPAHQNGSTPISRQKKPDHGIFWAAKSEVVAQSNMFHSCTHANRPTKVRWARRPETSQDVNARIGPPCNSRKDNPTAQNGATGVSGTTTRARSRHGWSFSRPNDL